MGIEEAMIFFGIFLLSIFILALLIFLFIAIFSFSVEDGNYLVAGLMIVAIIITIIGIHNLAKEEQPVADIEPSIVYNYCPTCGQLMEVENE
jgi:ABC-type Na+ efflux pump permease subunit